MRLPRAVIAVSFLIALVFLTFISLRSSHSSRKSTTNSDSTPKSGLNSLFSFRAPFSLFPPNAVITLTHENSTVFLARPGAFGPSLPQEGLNGRVWIGSGFGDDAIRHGTAAASVVGELGCSDVPGWGSSAKLGAAISRVTSGNDRPAPPANNPSKRGNDEDQPLDNFIDTLDVLSQGKKGASKPAASDGTDDYLHQSLKGSRVSRSNDPRPAESSGSHADIQSIQEGAEIAGKIVLLSRGGCGFLEKVKWAQRRGAIALIVGDDTKGGPLIQMYAREDTSNVTIPSVFTSRTTAHLLSSLVGPGNFIEDTVDEKGKPTLKVLHTDKPKKPSKKTNQQSTTTTTVAKATNTARPVASKENSSATRKEPAVKKTKNSGWFNSLLSSRKGSFTPDNNELSRKGQSDWVLVEDWRDEDRMDKSPTKSPKISTADVRDDNADDDFIIGVQDWRDPDLIGQLAKKNPKGDLQDKEDSKIAKDNHQPRTSGKEHVGPAQNTPDNKSQPGSGNGGYVGKASPEQGKSHTKGERDSASVETSKGLFNGIFGDDDEIQIPAATPSSTTNHAHIYEESEEDMDGDDEKYDGLWVTLTPTSGASPFLETILVLVVSPLITLTVVYTLLLVRSRVRRRRWRAPKSVVERLPVRTYQTIQTSGHQSPRLPSPSSSSAATPLLQQPPLVRPRPRSRTTSGIPEPGATNPNPLQVPSPAGGSQEHEKSSGISSQWKKYMGRQVECVVCLEEYVDGVSKVMSLPCGHEFHAECITPWLVTRRRTCPICKGDVVRSLARGSPSSPRYEPYIDDSDDDVQAHVAGAIDESSSSSLPIPRIMPDEGDLEAGLQSPTPTRRRRVDRPSNNWAMLIPASLRSTSRSPQSPQDDQDRDR